MASGDEWSTAVPDSRKILSPAASAYLDLLKRSLTGSLFPEQLRRLEQPSGWRRNMLRWARSLLSEPNLEFAVAVPHDPEERRVGRDRPLYAETMVGHLRLDNLQDCVADVVRNGVRGDLIETGVWRGGSAILMRAVLHALDDRSERKVWLADSFRGLPKPDPKRYAADEGDLFWTDATLAVSREQVEANIARYDLLDDRVGFLEGWFEDTLPNAPIDRLAVLRLDGDMYSSTVQALDALYPKLSVDGYVIVDDYGCVPACRQAVDDFRTAHEIHDEIHVIDWTGVYWRRSS